MGEAFFVILAHGDLGQMTLYANSGTIADDTEDAACDSDRNDMICFDGRRSIS